MNEIRITEAISCIPASENPLCADIGIIRESGHTWLYDVGNGEENIAGLKGSYRVVLSHFHQDHTGNIGKICAEELYVSKETCAHVHAGTIVDSDIFVGNLHIFPLPSSHTKGCLGLEINSSYAFVGDALYSRVKNGCYLYNAQLLQEEIAVLKSLKAPILLVSHFPGLIRKRDEVIAELEEIYAMRNPDNAEIAVSMG